MADRQETIADIIAEMRNRAKRPDFVSQDVLKSCADRLEAARKRERGDCAKLRIALETLRELLEDLLRLEDAEYHNDFSNFCDIIDAALAAPPRNCDRFANAVEAMAELKRVHSYCAKENRRCLEDCPDCGKEWCSLVWLFAPATESEAQA